VVELVFVISVNDGTDFTHIVGMSIIALLAFDHQGKPSRLPRSAGTGSLPYSGSWRSRHFFLTAPLERPGSNGCRAARFFALLPIHLSLIIASQCQPISQVSKASPLSPGHHHSRYHHRHYYHRCSELHCPSVFMDSNKWRSFSNP
jgi:hypothetical protein